MAPRALLAVSLFLFLAVASLQWGGLVAASSDDHQQNVFRAELHFGNIPTDHVDTTDKWLAVTEQHERILLEAMAKRLGAGTVKDVFIIDWKVHDESRLPTAVVTLRFETTLSRQTVIDSIQENESIDGGLMKLYYLQRIDSEGSTEVRRYRSTDDLAPCQNGGTLFPNGTCGCPDSTYGSQCETVNCGRYAIPQPGGICLCPASWNSFRCTLQSFHPAAAESLDTKARSLIFVVSLKSTMGPDISLLIPAARQLFQQWQSLHGYAPDSYILAGFVAYKNTSYVGRWDYSSSSSFLDGLSSLVISTGDTKQPVLSAIISAQQFSPLMHDRSDVYVFVDSAPSDAKPVDYIHTNPNPLSDIVSLATVWLSKVFLVNTGSLSASDVALYKQIARLTHGDYFQPAQKASLTEYFTVFKWFVRQENLAVRYDFPCDAAASIDFSADGSAAQFYVLTTGPGVTVVGSNPPSSATINIPSVFTQDNTTLFAAGSQAAHHLVISGAAGSICSARVFLSSLDTILFTWSDDPLIDAGNGVAIANMNMMNTGRPLVSFQFSNFSYIVRHSTTGAAVRPSPDTEVFSTDMPARSTHTHAFRVAPAAPLGESSTELRLLLPNGTLFQRVKPSYAFIELTNFFWSPQKDGCFNGGVMWANYSACTCSSLFTGQWCQTPVCQNGGSPNPFPGGPAGNPICSCSGGFQGIHCEIATCNPQSSENLQVATRTLVLALQTTYSQALVHDSILTSFTTFLNSFSAKHAAYYDSYVVANFANKTNGSTGKSSPTASWRSFGNASDFLAGLDSGQQNYSYTEASAQPAYYSLVQVLQAAANGSFTFHPRSPVFVFVDAPVGLTAPDEYNTLAALAAQTQAQLHFIVSPRYEDFSQCISLADQDVYFRLATATGGLLLNRCIQSSSGSTLPFITSYGAALFRLETVAEQFVVDCSKTTTLTFPVYDSTSTIYAFVNSLTIPQFTVTEGTNGGPPRIIAQSNSAKGTGIYPLDSSVTGPHSLMVSPATPVPAGTNATCYVKIAEQSIEAVLVDFVNDALTDGFSYFQPVLGAPQHASIRISTALQSDPTVSVSIPSAGFTSTSVIRRRSTCSFSYYVLDSVVCPVADDLFSTQVTLSTADGIQIQRSSRSFCSTRGVQCMNNGIFVDGQCHCGADWQGMYCEQRICRNGGSLTGGLCKCATGYSGDNCDYLTCNTGYDFSLAYDTQPPVFTSIALVVQNNANNAPAVSSITKAAATLTQAATTVGGVLPRHFSLTSFDENSVIAVAQSRLPTIFSRSLLGLPTYATGRQTTSVPSRATEALLLTEQLAIMSPTSIWLFLGSLPESNYNVSVLLTELLEKGSQVNAVYSPWDGSPFRIPTDGSFAVVQQAVAATNGRLLAVTPAGVQTVAATLIPLAAQENTLLLQDVQPSCASPGCVYTFVVDSRTAWFSLWLVATNASSSGTVQLSDASGSPFTLGSSIQLLSDSGTTVYRVFANASSNFAGQWRLSINSSGPVRVQVQASSSIDVHLGFTNQLLSGLSQAAPFFEMGSGAPFFVTARVRSQLDVPGQNGAITLQYLKIYSLDLQSGARTLLQSSALSARHPQSCAAQFVSTAIQSPAGTDFVFELSGVDGQQQPVVRVFQVHPAQKNCVNGKRDSSGLCVCDAEHWGETCEQRVCGYGATPEGLVCNCKGGTGEFCTTAYLLYNSSATSTTTTTTTTTTTSPSTASTTTGSQSATTPSTAATTAGSVTTQSTASTTTLTTGSTSSPTSTTTASITTVANGQTTAPFGCPGTALQIVFFIDDSLVQNSQSFGVTVPKEVAKGAFAFKTTPPLPKLTTADVPSGMSLCVASSQEAFDSGLDSLPLLVQANSTFDLASALLMFATQACPGNTASGVPSTVVIVTANPLVNSDAAVQALYSYYPSWPVILLASDQTVASSFTNVATKSQIYSNLQQAAQFILLEACSSPSSS